MESLFEISSRGSEECWQNDRLVDVEIRHYFRKEGNVWVEYHVVLVKHSERGVNSEGGLLACPAGGGDSHRNQGFERQ